MNLEVTKNWTFLVTVERLILDIFFNGGVLTNQSIKTAVAAVAITMSSSLMAFENQMENAIKWLSQNISAHGTVPGTVLASPSRESPNYYYHWVRDAGLVMSTWLDVRNGDVNQSVRDRIDQNIEDYWRLTLRHQTQNLPAGLGEVKFEVNGDVYRGPWGRPQNDGPAIRALSLMKWRDNLLFRGSPLAENPELYASSLPANSAIKRDLEYVAHLFYKTEPNGKGRLLEIWERPGDFDVWEEVRGHHFFTELFQMYALRKGAELSESVGDHAQDFYNMVADKIESELNYHWDDNRGFIESTIYRDDGIDYKSGLDSAVIIAVLETQPYAYLGKGSWTVLDPRVQATAERLESAFKKLYPINQRLGAFRAALIGRYPEDTYDGVRTGSRGNPWFLCSHYMAEFYYQLTNELNTRGELQITAASRQFWNRFLPSDTLKLSSQDPQWKPLLKQLVFHGDSILNHLNQHVGPFGNMSEQIDRDTGNTGANQGGAQDLSWSYSSYIRAAQARSKVHNQ